MKKLQKKNADSTASTIKINRSRDSGKKRTDLFARLRNTEHPLDNIFPDTELEAKSVGPIQPILSNDNLSYPIQSKVNQKPVAPIKDFQKVPNSITRDAIPNKFFKGTSKSTYDALYLKTRGAINPVRTIKATKRELMKWIGISHVTIFKHLKHLELIGLLKIEQQIGSHNGSIYEVFIPEEVLTVETHTNQTNTSLSNPILTHSTQPIQSNDSQSNANLSNKVVSVPSKEVVLDRMGNVIENKPSYSDPKTSFKDNKDNDDETAAPFSEFLEKISAACKKVTGNPTTKREREKWGTLADLLILELELAAKKTDSISSAPAFLTEVLRRKLFSGNVPVSAKQSKVKLDTVGQPNESGEYEKKPLDEKGRAEALTQLQEFVNDDFLQDFEKWYTAEDWNWLTNQLDKNKKSKSFQ